MRPGRRTSSQSGGTVLETVIWKRIKIGRELIPLNRLKGWLRSRQHPWLEFHRSDVRFECGLRVLRNLPAHPDRGRSESVATLYQASLGQTVRIEEVLAVQRATESRSRSWGHGRWWRLEDPGGTPARSRQTAHPPAWRLPKTKKYRPILGWQLQDALPNRSQRLHHRGDGDDPRPFASLVSIRAKKRSSRGSSAGSSPGNPVASGLVRNEFRGSIDYTRQ